MWQERRLIERVSLPLDDQLLLLIGCLWHPQDAQLRPSRPALFREGLDAELVVALRLQTSQRHRSEHRGGRVHTILHLLPFELFDDHALCPQAIHRLLTVPNEGAVVPLEFLLKADLLRCLACHRRLPFEEVLSVLDPDGINPLDGDFNGRGQGVVVCLHHLRHLFPAEHQLLSVVGELDLDIGVIADFIHHRWRRGGRLLTFDLPIGQDPLVHRQRDDAVLPSHGRLELGLAAEAADVAPGLLRVRAALLFHPVVSRSVVAQAGEARASVVVVHHPP
mmetsp:Transcript_93620/g.303027  ORF Transcript_93620/g.303027 Transcript_93620/m.303027 type:complete len:278 (+) Transcript_93620:2959-3792(+)